MQMPAWYGQACELVGCSVHNGFTLATPFPVFWKDGVLVENMHDVPYLNRRVGPETTAAMAAVCSAVRSRVPSSMPCGVQILAGANR